MPKIISKHIKCCPYCGGEEYIIKQYYFGYGEYRLRFDGEEADNTEFHASAEYRNTSKYAWCKECNKRLFKLDD